MGGVQEHIGRAAGQALIVRAGADLVAAIVDRHESPSVLSAVIKQQATDRGRAAFQDAMDVMAGSAICRGAQQRARRGVQHEPGRCPPHDRFLVRTSPPLSFPHRGMY